MHICNMKKKNTLLYLDEELVKIAKRYDLNISQVTEAAIKSKLFPELSQGKQIVLGIPEHLENMKKEGTCFFLPKTINSVKVEDIGFLKNQEISFKNGLNFVVGCNGCGKTTLIHGIAQAFCLEKPNVKMIHWKSYSGSVEVKTSGKPIKIKYNNPSEADVTDSHFQCILLDCPDGRLDNEQRKKFFEDIQELYKCQIISTTPNPPENVKANVIKIKSIVPSNK